MNPIRPCPAGLHTDGYTGRARMVVDEDQGYLLGAAPIPLSVNSP